MTPLAWAHLPGCLYPERAAAPETPVDEWLRAALGPGWQQLRRGSRRYAADARSAERLETMAQALDPSALHRRLRRAAEAAWRDGRELPLALALVREAARRSLGLRPYASQLFAVGCLLDGRMAEMAAGEGKTLTAGLAAALVASAGVPVHVATVNDYLARRDAEELGPLFRHLGLSVGVVVSGMEPSARRAAYACDIAYCTGKELVFDYLKDRAVGGPGLNQAQLRLARLLGDPAPQPLLRGLHYAIVDEADSVLIDEARTPLILSQAAGPAGEQALLRDAIDLARALERGRHYELHDGRRELALLPAGRLWLTERAVLLGGEWTVRHAREHWVLQALRGLYLFRRDEHYVVKDGKVLIVDEHTGRALPGRTWEQGLHQVIETLEGCALSDHARTVARITYQRFFRRYLRLAGMTGTAREVRRELWRDYRLSTVAVPLHRPCRRIVEPPACEPDAGRKWLRIAARAGELAGQGRAVLVGTRSVAASQQLSHCLAQRGIDHRVLNALQDAGEAELVAAAGQPGSVTVATNMAGRGTDIKLGGGGGVALAGGLHVILSEFHESRRIDRQLFGRAARQGDPGSVQAIVSLDDALFRQHTAPALLAVLRPLLTSRRGAAALELLRRMAQRRSEHLHARNRRHAVQEDRRLETLLSFSGRH